MRSCFEYFVKNCGKTFVFACPPAPVRRRPSSSHLPLHTSPCCRGGSLVLYRAERVLGGACRHQSQLSGRSEMAERGGSVQQQLRTLSGYSSGRKKKREKKQAVESGLKMLFLKSTCSENVPQKFIKRIVFLCVMASFWLVWEMKKLLPFIPGVVCSHAACESAPITLFVPRTSPTSFN